MGRRLKVLNYKKSQNRILERRKDRRFLVGEKDGKERVHDMDSNHSDTELGVEPAEVIQTPYSISPGLTKARAKELFMIYRWDKKELLELGIPESTLTSWLNHPTETGMSWRQERDIFDRSVLEKMKEKAAETMGEAYSRGMNILSRSLLQADLDQKMLDKPREYKEMISALKDFKNLIEMEKQDLPGVDDYLSYTQKQITEIVDRLDKLDPLMSYDPTGKVN